MVAAKESISSSILTSPSDLEVDTINLGQSHMVIMRTIYIPPSAPEKF